jgi:hypothetical protein
MTGLSLIETCWTLEAVQDFLNLIQGDLMRIATLADVDLIKNILLVSFRNDPHVTWLLEKSKNKVKLKVLIDYVVHQAG